MIEPYSELYAFERKLIEHGFTFVNEFYVPGMYIQYDYRDQNGNTAFLRKGVFRRYWGYTSTDNWTDASEQLSDLVRLLKQRHPVQ